MVREISHCRLCRSAMLVTVLDLGNQALTGIFPQSKNEHIPSGPLTLVKCTDCGLVQLKHSYEPSELYGAHYGYRSGLNSSMVEHLKNKVSLLKKMVKLEKNDIAVDIGSNDGTLLGFYPDTMTLVGFDPSAEKFKKYYRSDIQLVTDFFSAKKMQEVFPKQKAKIITSISMFYDLEAPLEFVEQVYSILAEDGTWHFEQSYLPRMLETNSYDTICHEHLEYYALRQIAWIAERSGFRVADVTLNDVNGGSFAVTAVKDGSPAAGHAPAVATMLASEAAAGLDTLAPYQAFAARALKNRDDLRALVRRLRAEGKRVFGLGASTKGNVTLQYCGFTEADLGCIAEVNEDKFGSFTPGTKIPICSEREAYAGKPDYLLVLPWHFRAGLVRGAAGFLKQGGKLIFPLPQIEIVG